MDEHLRVARRVASGLRPRSGGPFFRVAVLIAAAAAAASAAVQPHGGDAPMSLVRSIELPGVQGRIDHLAFDTSTQRLFVAALGNDTVEVIDTKAGTHVASVAGFAEPQGIAVAPESRIVMVANRRNGQVQQLNADDFSHGPGVRPGRDADNVRYDATAGRFYVGFGSGATAAVAAIGAQDARLIGEVAVPGHPESFQYEHAGPRMFVNVPTADALVVIDRSAMKVAATFPVTAAQACFPMAFDEANHRLFIVCREPARLLVLDSTNGRVVTALDTVQDADDLFYDAARKRLYVSGGEGFLDVITEPTPNVFARMARLTTAPGARTSLFVAEQNRLYVAVPHRDTQRAEIREFKID